MRIKLITVAALLAASAPGFASPEDDLWDEEMEWCIRYKQRYGYQAPDGPNQPCFQMDQYRGLGDDSRSVGVRRERWGVDGMHPAHPTTRPPNE